MYQADAAIARSFRQPNPTVAESTNENSRQVFKLVDGAIPKAAQESSGHEPSFLDHFTNFFTRIAKAIENHSTRSKFDSRIKNATDEFFHKVKFGSKNSGATSAKNFNQLLTEIDGEVDALDADLAKEIKEKIQKSIDKATSKFSHRLIYKDNSAVEARRESILQEMCAWSKTIGKNSGNHAGLIASDILGRKQYADNCAKIRRQISSLVPDTWVDAVDTIATNNNIKWDQATSLLIKELKRNIGKAFPDKSEDALVELLDSDWSGFECQFGDGEPYHPQSSDRYACEKSVDSYLEKNRSALDIKICEFILSNLSYKSYFDFV